MLQNYFYVCFIVEFVFEIYLQDDAGNQVWICPTCGKQDDGSPMVGCDGCDAWYHWYVILLFKIKQFI